MLTKVVWLAVCIALRVVGAVLVVFLGVGVNLHNPLANRKQRPIPEEIYHTLLTNKKQGNLN
jgi:hypothetical protein